MQETKKYVIGLMSGTSLDGVDLVYVSFEEEVNYNFEIICAKTYPYSEDWKSKLQNAFIQSSDVVEQLDLDYGIYLGNLINEFIAINNIDKVDFVASHGHTIFHKPDEGFTLQIGNGKRIAEVCNHKVIYDFRSQDLVYGGQGAPLVPIGDDLLFSEYEYCLNLGGFANVSFNKNGKRIALDICPVNIVMNYYVNRLGLDYDDEGKLAASGKVNYGLLIELNAIPFYNESAPKSLGYEFVVSKIFPIIDKYKLSVKDILRTFVEHVSIQISEKINSQGKLFITGGGAFNLFLIDQMRKSISNEIVIPNEDTINFKEALIFALLGLLRLENKVNCLQSVTGAKKDHSSGLIYSPN